MDALVDEAVKRIAADRSMGAVQLAGEALKTLRLLVTEGEAEDAESLALRIKAAGLKLAEARVSMAPLRNLTAEAVYLILKASESLSLSELRSYGRDEIDRLLLELREAPVKVAGYALSFIRGKTVATHSLSSTVSLALEKARPKKVVVSESRPLMEGRKTAVKASSFAKVTLVTDAALGLFVSEADCVAVGCDTLLADGSVVNKVGTYLLGLAAKDNGVPFYVLTELSKVSFLKREEVKLEEMDPREVADPKALPGNVEVRNVYFDVTPSRLVTEVITEEGPIKPADVERYAERYKRYVKSLEEG